MVKKKRYVKKAPKPVTGRSWGIQIQTKGKSNPKQPSCRKRVRPSKRLWWKKMWNPRWRPRNGCDGRLMVKILITTNQENFVPRPSGIKFAWFVVIKVFTINLPSQPFLGRHLGFHVLFHHSHFEGRTLFLQLSCFGLDILFQCSLLILVGGLREGSDYYSTSC